MSSVKTYKQPWLGRWLFDSLYILLPGYVALFVVFFLPNKFKTTDEVPLVAWVVLILLIDVAHVYSTLFRTYWDKQRFAANRRLYIMIPVLCYIVGVLLYTIDGLLFWRMLAYLAVFHFIRQQYGFMRLYSRYEPKHTVSAVIDKVAIYAATLYPLLYWHCTPGRNFNWFVDGDFLIGSATILKDIGLYLYLAILLVYIAKEVTTIVKSRHINLPKNLVIISTVVTWYFGIVYFNGDMAFTLLNVVAHGIPYMALIWLFNKKEETGGKERKSFIATYRYSFLFFLLSIFLFAYLEEGIWDGMIWHDHGTIFNMFSFLPSPKSKEVFALLIPLLSLPQSTHYVLDGFIWRKRD